MRRRRIRFLSLATLLCAVSCSSGQREAQTADLPQAAPITVRGDDGKVIGTLSGRDHPPQLLFDAPDGQRVRLGECHDEVRHESLGGSGRTARVEVRNCGATVDFATRVLVFGAEGDLLVAVFAGQPETRLNWTGPDTLVVHSERLDGERVFLRRERVGSITVRYVADRRPTLATPDDALDFASLNFAASGCASGMSIELMQRIAGWSQQASGLYEPAWDTWAGKPPFGDDPRGHAQILAGVAYYKEKYGVAPTSGQKTNDES